MTHSTPLYPSKNRQLLLPLLAAATGLLALYQPLPSGLDEQTGNLPQGLFWGYGVAKVQLHSLQLSMPMSPVLAYLLYRLPQAAESLVWPVFYLLSCTSAFSLAAALSSPWAGALAAIFTASALVLRLPSFLATPEQMLYALSCGLTAFCLLKRASRPRTFATEALCGASMGVSLFIKSPLFLLPFLLAAADIRSNLHKNDRLLTKKLAILCATPYAMLLPWVGVNYALTGEFRLFESGRADQNIISGALGIACAIEGARSLAQVPEGGSYLLWGIKTVISHPINYLSGLFSRALILFEWYPAALTTLGLGLARFRTDPRWRAILLFLAYYAGIHCLLSIQERYFLPIWPVALAAAAGLFFPREPGQTVFPKIFFSFLAVPLAALYLYSSALLLAYPYRSNLTGHTLRNPEKASAPILVLLSAQALSSGDQGKAEHYARLALLSRPDNSAKRAYLYCLAAKGTDIRPILAKDPPLPLDNPRDRKEQDYLLLANALSAQNDALAASAMRAAWLSWRLSDSSFRRVTSFNESSLQKMQSEDNTYFQDWELPNLARKFPPKRRPEIIAAMSRAGMRSQALSQLMAASLLELRPPQPSVHNPSAPPQARPVPQPDAKIPKGGETRPKDSASKPVQPAAPKRQTAHPNQARHEPVYAVIEKYRLNRPLTTREMTGFLEELRRAGMDAAALRQLAATARNSPEAGPRFKRLEKLHESRRYAELVRPAQEYLKDYPYDQVATLFLAVAFLNTGDHQNAAACLEVAEKLPLEPHEQKWLLALRTNLAKELRGDARR